MLSFSTAEASSIDAFLSVSAASPYQRNLREYAHRLLHQRCTRPEWCVLGSDANVPVARAALWAVPNEPTPSDVVLIDGDWHERGLASVTTVLQRVHELAAALGADELQHHVDSPPGPPQYQEHAPDRIKLLTDSGYELQRDGLRWLYTSSTGAGPTAEGSPVFRGLPEVGEEAFLATFAATYEGTRDSILDRHVREHGLHRA